MPGAQPNLVVHHWRSPLRSSTKQYANSGLGHLWSRRPQNNRLWIWAKRPWMRCSLLANRNPREAGDIYFGYNMCYFHNVKIQRFDQWTQPSLISFDSVWPHQVELPRSVADSSWAHTHLCTVLIRRQFVMTHSQSGSNIRNMSFCSNHIAFQSPPNIMTFQ